ncbi:hypothetical protein EBX31_08620 [bacterium]|nr:hypothetical protein [bacterium]
MGAAAGSSGQCLKLVESIQQGAESAQIAAIEGDAKAGQGSEFRFVGLFGIGIADGDQGVGTEDVVEIVVEPDQRPGRDLPLHPDDHDISHVAVGVEVVVEVDDFPSGEFEIIGEF